MRPHIQVEKPPWVISGGQRKAIGPDQGIDCRHDQNRTRAAFAQGSLPNTGARDFWLYSRMFLIAFEPPEEAAITQFETDGKVTVGDHWETFSVPSSSFA